MSFKGSTIGSTGIGTLMSAVHVYIKTAFSLVSIKVFSGYSLVDLAKKYCYLPSAFIQFANSVG
ncbi:MAG: hypothetical protein ACK4HE_08835 [Chitinophagaceae bacterium]